jgi:predicted DCC family thiol-disulfide oxidoreductase YuxK
MTAKPSTPRGWVLYDAACGFCSWWVPLWKATLARRGFDIAPLQSAWVRERMRLAEEELVRDIRLLFVDGTSIAGGEVYLHVMQRIWWARPCAWTFRLPGLRWLFEQTYRAFNRNRFAISRACRLSRAPTGGYGDRSPESESGRSLPRRPNSNQESPIASGNATTSKPPAMTNAFVAPSVREEPGANRYSRPSNRNASASAHAAISPKRTGRRRPRFASQDARACSELQGSTTTSTSSADSTPALSGSTTTQRPAQEPQVRSGGGGDVISSRVPQCGQLPT